MNTQEVLELIQTLKDTGYKHIDVTHEDTHILLSNSEFAGAAPMPPMPPMMPPGMPVHHGPQMEANELVKDDNTVSESEQTPVVASSSSNKGHVIESPIVGTYYSSATPDSEEYVAVGSKVKKGDVLCIIEAMKLMNEIEADQDGEIAEIYVENEQGVEFGQPLFRIV